ncbi:hypothetical protein E2562_011112 [Oryza meyeriana var. granulata]|uniref:Uncharacterized protein n=1 Tax=Oryza meyeriana var. granulata TaxID=110450 RepID=A0A6G1EWI5_9ORYZ|nr:hypothetical protein E2562_011112 [Oryza meyeriana var. granulata]
MTNSLNEILRFETYGLARRQEEGDAGLLKLLAGIRPSPVGVLTGQLMGPPRRGARSTSLATPGDQSREQARRGPPSAGHRRPLQALIEGDHGGEVSRMARGAELP